MDVLVIYSTRVTLRVPQGTVLTPLFFIRILSLQLHIDDVQFIDL